MLQCRGDFASFGGRVWLNAAAHAPLPLVAGQVARRAAEDELDPRQINEHRLLRAAEGLRTALAQLLHSPADQIALGASTTYGIRTVATGLHLRAGDDVLVVAGDYPACAYPWLALQRQGVTVRVHRPQEYDVTADALCEDLTEHTRVVCLSWVNSTTGRAVDVEALAQRCHEREVFVVVDAAQAVGARTIDATRTAVDAIAACGHKWLCGPYGTGFCWLSDRLLDALTEPEPYWHTASPDIASTWRSGPSYRFRADLRYAFRDDLPRSARFDAPSLGGLSTRLAWTAAINYLLTKGIAAIEKHNALLTEHLIANLPQDRFYLVSAKEGTPLPPLVVIRSPRRSAVQDLSLRLEAAGIDVTLRDNALRVAPHIYNSLEDIDRALDILTYAT